MTSISIQVTIGVLTYIVRLLHSSISENPHVPKKAAINSKGGIPIIVVDLRNSKPIYEQIKDNIKHLIVSGALKQDEKLPSIRELAQTTSINPNTIQKAFRDLESDGFIYTITGRGNFVAPSPKLFNPKRIQELYDTLKGAIAELNFLGIPESEILAVIHDTISQGGSKA